MSEEANQVVEEENLQGTDQPTESEEHNDVSQEDQLTEQRKRNDAEYNWAEMRRQMREKDQQIEELRAQFSSIAERQPSKKEEDELANLAEDDILTVAQAKKLAQKLARNVATEVLQERDNSTVDERVQLKFPDFNEVVTKDNIDLLKQTEPELAQTLADVADPYKKAVAAYKLLKKVSVKTDGPSLEKQRAEDNSKKPVSVNAVTKQSAIGNAHLFENGLTKELKQSLWKEMQQSMKGA
ncbi:MAG: hypothetical protein ACLFUW_00270 [Bacteroidales bacterium]